jgi:hypothetical protein
MYFLPPRLRGARSLNPESRWPSSSGLQRPYRDLLAETKNPHCAGPGAAVHRGAETTGSLRRSFSRKLPEVSRGWPAVFCKAPSIAAGCYGQGPCRPLGCLPARLQPAHVQIDNGSCIKRQSLAEHRPAHNGDAQRPPQLRSGAQAERQREVAEQSRHGGHHDGAEAQQTGFENRLLGGFSLTGRGDGTAESDATADRYAVAISKKWLKLKKSLKQNGIKLLTHG